MATDFTREPTDLYAQISMKQELLQLSVENGLAKVYDQQRNLESTLMDCIASFGASQQEKLALAGRRQENKKKASFPDKGEQISETIPDEPLVECVHKVADHPHKSVKLHPVPDHNTNAKPRERGKSIRQKIDEEKTNPIVAKAVQEEADKILKDAAAFKKQQADLRAKQRKSGQMLKKRTGGSGDGFLERIVNAQWFDSLCAMVIISNSVLIGVSVNYMTDHLVEHHVLVSLGHAFNTWFTIELFLRMKTQGRQYFCNHDWKWNWFDFSLVGITFLDVVFLDILKVSGSWNISTGLKIIKMLRIVRIFRVFRFSKELSLLALMIMDSLKSLVWALLMLTIIIYVFAICFTQGASDYLKDNPGVFVDNAVETAKTEREFLVQKEMELKEKYIQEMHDLFAEMDEDGNGTITHEELMNYFEDARVRSYFHALGLDTSDRERLFSLMDDDGSGEVSIDEFLDGCLRLKGSARSLDVHQAIQEIKRVQARLEHLAHPTSDEVVYTSNQSDVSVPLLDDEAS